MLKLGKIISTVVFSSIAFSANAAFYVGAGGGPEIATFSEDAHITLPESNVYNNTKLSGRGYFGSIFAGYGRYLTGPDLHTKNVYLAAEINANASNVEYQGSNNNLTSRTFSTTTYKMDHSFGLSILPGFLLTDSTLFYVRLGYAYGNFKLFTNDVSLTPVNENVSGFCHGFGVRQMVKQNFMVFMEVSQTNYQGVQIHTLSTNNTVKDVNITPVTAQLEFGLLYNFTN